MTAMIRDIPIENLELSIRATNALRKAGYVTFGQVQDLFKKPRSEIISSIKNFGGKSYWETYHALNPVVRDDRDPVADWVRAHRDTIRAILADRAVVVPTYWDAQ